MSDTTRFTALDYSDLLWVNQLAADFERVKAERDDLLALVRDADTECPVWCEQRRALLARIDGGAS